MRKILFLLLFIQVFAFGQGSGRNASIPTSSASTVGQVLSNDGSKLVWITPSGSGATTTAGISDWATAWDARLSTKTTTNVPEGTNLYFTNARVNASTLTGFVSGAGVIAPTDNVLQAIQKLDGNKVFSKTQAVTSNYTLMASDEFIGVQTSGITLSLPDPSTNEGRKVSVVMMVEGTCNFNYPIYRTKSGSGVINSTVISTDNSAGAGWGWNSVDLVVMNGQYWLY